MVYNVPGFPDGRRTTRLSLLLVIQGASSEVCHYYNVPGSPEGRRTTRLSLLLVIQGPLRKSDDLTSRDESKLQRGWFPRWTTSGISEADPELTKGLLKGINDQT